MASGGLRQTPVCRTKGRSSGDVRHPHRTPTVPQPRQLRCPWALRSRCLPAALEFSGMCSFGACPTGSAYRSSPYVPRPSATPCHPCHCPRHRQSWRKGLSGAAGPTVKCPQTRRLDATLPWTSAMRLSLMSAQGACCQVRCS